MTVRIYSIASNYTGTANELCGCLNDQTDLIAKFNEVAGKKTGSTTLTGSQVTLRSVKDLFSEAFQRWALDGVHPVIANSGHGTNGRDPNNSEADGICEGWYLDSGEVFWDYLMQPYLDKFPAEAGLAVIDDSCFSGGEGKTKGGQKVRFVKTSDVDTEVPIKIKRRTVHRETEMNYVWLSASAEDQASADTSFNGHANGAFTYYFMQCLRAKDSLKEVHKNVSKKLPSRRFTQKPQLYGNPKIFNQPFNL